MFSLVQFKEDMVYYVCKSSQVRSSNNNVLAQWTNRNYYPARVIAVDDRFHVLNDFKANLTSGNPRVVLSVGSSIEYTHEKEHQHFKASYSASTNDSPLVVNSHMTNCTSNGDNSSQNLEMLESALEFPILIDQLQVNDEHCYSYLSEDPFPFLNDSVDVSLSSNSDCNRLQLVGDVDLDRLTAEDQNTIILGEVRESGVHVESIDEDNIVSCEETNSSVPIGTYVLDVSNICPDKDPYSLVNVIEEEEPVIIIESIIQEDINSCGTINYEAPSRNSNLSVLNKSASDESPSNFTEEMLEQIVHSGEECTNVDKNSKDQQGTSILNALRQPMLSSVREFDRAEVMTPSCSYNVQGVVRNVSVEPARGRTTRRYFCVYCKKLYAKFSQHLEVSHKNELPVAKFMNLPPRCAERKKIIETIRRRGDFEHNTNPEYNTGALFVARRSQTQVERTTENYLPCPYCAAFFNRRTIYMHVKYCKPSSTTHTGRKTVILGRKLLSDVHSRACEMLRSNVFPVLREDDCVSIIRYDLLVILLGNHWCSKYPSQHHHDMIRSKLRSIGRLILTSKSFDNTVTDFASLLTPAKFDVVVESIRVLGGLNSNRTTYKAPTTVLCLSTVCKQAVSVWKTECIKTSNKEAQQKAEDFLCLFNTAFPAELGRTAMDNRLQSQRHKNVELPAKSDIEKLVIFLRTNRRKYFQEVKDENCSNLNTSWRQLASFTLVSVMLFNRRRPGELERITLSDYSKLRSAGSITDSTGNLRGKEDVNLARRYKRFEIRGKLNRTVPVLINYEIEVCLDLIIQKRRDVNVPSDNPYVFGIPSLDHRYRYLRAYALLREYADKCGASNPHLLRGTQLRKQIATECAVRDLADNVIKDVANFMGHAIDIHDNIYRMPVENRDITRMSRILEMAQGAENISDDNSSDDDEIPLECSSQSETQVTQNHHSAINCKLPPITAEPEAVEPEAEGQSSKKLNSSEPGTHVKGLKRICSSKTPWSSSEKNAVLNHFDSYLKRNKLPSTSEICEQLPYIHELSSRSPTSVRLWLHGQLVRQRDSFSNSDSLSTPNSLPARISKARWSASMKQKFFKYFQHHLNSATLPDSRECRMIIEQEPEFRHLTAAAVKTAVANEQKRRIIKPMSL